MKVISTESIFTRKTKQDLFSFFLLVSRHNRLMKQELGSVDLSIPLLKFDFG